MKLKKTLAAAFLAALILMSAVLPTGADPATYSWYCVRTKDNLRPPCPREYADFEEGELIWIDPYARDGAEEKVVYLTFDAGYENGNISKILDTLGRRGVKGTFFILGNLIAKEPELVRRMAEEGHTVGSHTYRHIDMSRATREEIASELGALEVAYKKCTGRELTRCLRPPEGRFSRESLKISAELGYTSIFWSFAYADWDNGAQPDPERALKKIRDNMHNGAIVLLHPTSSTNAAILGELIDRMISEGYRFATVEELCAGR